MRYKVGASDPIVAQFGTRFVSRNKGAEKTPHRSKCYSNTNQKE